MKQLRASLLALGCALLASSCIVPRPFHPRPARVIAAGHVHGARCGHTYAGNRWVFTRGHVHGPRCGHVFARGRWCAR